MTTTQEKPTTLSKTYDPSVVEQRVYALWEKAGYFQPTDDPDAEPYCITIPPPNVTGELHLGHALTYSIEDVLGRYKRMRGFATLILPGSDHASLAVHAKLEADLAKRGVRRRFDMTREAFMQEAWAWKARYSAAITNQFRALGEAYDWSRERFTLDPAYDRAVRTMFVQLYDEGHIYRGHRVINWCSGCQTGISDIEVRQDEREDTLYFVRLPFAPDNGDGLTTANDQKLETLVIATARPETMFGDVAVAVHPDDERYRGAVGRHLHHPLTGNDIPVIADEFVDPKFGSGAVKITPAHDYADFEVGERHDLPMPVVITPHATMAHDVPEAYRGLPIGEARAMAVEELRRQGLLERTEPLLHNVPVCDRCGTVIEPLLSEQWFMHMNELAQPAIDAVRTGKVRFVPERWARIYLEWMENIRPWNISRQLWWGHRIPIFTCANGHVTAAIDPPNTCAECGSGEIAQDPDVLDTWFSAALWPFASLGWPDDTPDLRRFYPTAFMNTSSQILYLWIARMIMMGIHFMGEIPFPVVLINPTILNEKGQRMSKSLGTGIDPLETIERYGADATRFGVLSSGSMHQQEIRFSGWDKSEEGRKFANKIWNAARLVLRELEGASSKFQVPSSKVRVPRAETSAAAGDPSASLALSDRWVLSRMAAVTEDVTGSLERLDLSVGIRGLYDFFWSEFADWYLEIAKLRLRAGDGADGTAVRAVLWSVLERSMRLLHPYMPFVTEEVWAHLRDAEPSGARALSGLGPEPLSESMMMSPWPAAGVRDAAAEEGMAVVMRLVGAIRNLRSEHRVSPKTLLTAEAAPSPHDELLRSESPIICGLAGLESLDLGSSGKVSAGESAQITVDGISIRIPLADLTDVSEEIARLERELARSQSEAQRLDALLGNEAFVKRAPEAVVSAERAKLDGIRGSIAEMESQMERFRRP